jgi:hypothetical protein
VRLGALLAGPVAISFVVTPEVEFGFVPTVLLLTTNVTVQLLLAGIVIPLKLRAVAFAANAFGAVPTQVPPTAPPTALMLTRVSVNDPLVKGDALPLFNVKVTVELPPDWMAVGLKALVIEGGPVTARVAMLLAVPGVVVCAVVTPEVEFGFIPGVLLVTSKATVQLLAAGMVIPLKLSAVAPATRVAGSGVPPQVVVTAPPTADILTSVSVNEALVSGIALLLLNVRVTVDVPPDAIAVGEKPFVIVGAARTVRVSVLLTGPAVVVCVVVTPEVEFGYEPAVPLVTAKMTVQVTLFAGIVMPLKVNNPAWFTVSVLLSAPVQVPPTVPPTATKLAARVSVNEAPVSAVVLVLVSVKVMFDMLPA